MVLHYTLDLNSALRQIEFAESAGQEHEFIVQEAEQLRTAEALHNDEVLHKYGEAKWAIIELLNQHYAQYSGQANNRDANNEDFHNENFHKTTHETTHETTHDKTTYDLYHWLLENKEDEVAYFLNEAGSNCLTHSQYKAPSKFRLWLGKKGFILSLEQKGAGFAAQEIAQKKPGGFFTFFKQSRSLIFFDYPEKARAVFLQVLF